MLFNLGSFQCHAGERRKKTGLVWEREHVRAETCQGEMSEMGQMGHGGFTEVRTEIHHGKVLYLVLTNISKKMKGNLYDREQQILLEGLAESRPLAEDQHAFFADVSDLNNEATILPCPAGDQYVLCV